MLDIASEYSLNIDSARIATIRASFALFLKEEAGSHITMPDQQRATERYSDPKNRRT